MSLFGKFGIFSFDGILIQFSIHRILMILGKSGLQKIRDTSAPKN